MQSTKAKNNNKGVALIVCITIIAILVILCFSLLLVSYTLYASQNKNQQSDRNAEAAKSLNMAIRQELTEGSLESNLCTYLRFNVQQEKTAENGSKYWTWPYYEPGVAGHGETEAKRYFTLNKYQPDVDEKPDTIAGYPSKVELCMYWMRPEEDPTAVDNTRLFIEIEVESGSQSYVIKSEYKLVRVLGNTPNMKSASLNPAENTVKTDEAWTWNYVGSE